MRPKTLNIFDLFIFFSSEEWIKGLKEYVRANRPS
jgi:hypothetical protein